MRADALGDVARWHRASTTRPAAIAVALTAPVGASGLERITDVPIYATDPIVRRAPALQAHGRRGPAVVGLPSALWLQLGDKVHRDAGQGAAVALPAREDKTLRRPDAVCTCRRRTRALGDVRPDRRRKGRRMIEQSTPAARIPCSSATTRCGSACGWSLIKIVAVVLPLMGCVAYLTLWERKAIGWTQIRPARTASAPGAC